ncbi:transmembrane protein [Anaeramoeba flamelloides]|uniref:Transmembrane protein n=1 Tax=Anaeramoeba flamelloides TaxID=1746091 RepID=A0ABQ8Y5L6_9EUKA|nr:transmembrane protein [Anaeramoeba flamelloides]
MQTDQMRMKIDTWDKRHFVCFFILLVLFTIIGISIGAVGPEVYQEQELQYDFEERKVKILLEIDDLNRLNQFINVDIHFKNKFSVSVKEDVQFNLTLRGSDDKKIPEDQWKIVGETVHKRQVPNSNCTKHTIINEPYLFYQNYFASLEITNIAKEDYFSKAFVDKKGNRSFKKFYLPKLIPLFVIWITFLALYIWNRVHEADDPQYETIHDVPGFLAAEIIMWIFCAIYLLFLLYAVIRSFIEVRKLEEHKKRFYFFFTTSVIILIFSLIALAGNYIHKIRNTSGEFLSTFTIFNVYLVLITYPYFPSSEMISDLKDSAHLRLDEDDLEDDMYLDQINSHSQSSNNEENINEENSDKSEKSEKKSDQNENENDNKDEEQNENENENENEAQDEDEK